MLTIMDKLNNLKTAMDTNMHISNPKTVTNILDSLGDAYAELPGSEKDYYTQARAAVENQTVWAVEAEEEETEEETD
jgi:hypothetical protein